MKKFFGICLAAMVALCVCTAFAAAYVPGSYTTTAEGNNGAIKLTVMVSDTAITDIKVVEQGETTGLGDVAIDQIISEIIKNNSTAVDTVSGATVSSKAVIAAVDEALARAVKGDVDTEAAIDTNAATQTFEQQCKAAGIDLNYVDPNADAYVFTSTDPTVDMTTGASGDAKYIDEKDGPCIRTAADLAARSAVKAKVYYWIADEKGVSTLEEAAKLENAQYVSYAFPGDGAKYSIKLQQSSIGCSIVSTVSKDNQPNAAVFGMKYAADEKNPSVVNVSCAIMAETETYENILAGSGILITYYEYNPYSELKIGVGTRNAGARVVCVMDVDQSLIVTEKDAEGNAKSFTVAEYKALSDEEKAALQINYLKLIAPVTELFSIG